LSTRSPSRRNRSPSEPFGIDLKGVCLRLGYETIGLCLRCFRGQPFRSTKAAIKLRKLLDLRSNIPAFIPISDGKMHEGNILDQLLPKAPRVLHRWIAVPVYVMVETGSDEAAAVEGHWHCIDVATAAHCKAATQ
jgi:hypothetical protein